VGDDQLRDRFYARIGEALRALSDAGVPLFVARGNRDFLIGSAFAAATGATLLPERTVLPLGGRSTLLTHGDELCTDDVAYQRFRARTRAEAWRAGILRKPYWVRRGMAAYLRMRGRTATAMKPESIMDVNDAAVADAFRRHGVTRLVHGHTHRPARHDLSVDGVIELERLNDAYERRHGFRYCVFVAGRPREALIPDMARAIEADRTTELHRAIDAVVDIAIDRHGKLTRR
jgi:UDP-2,3-diacylglucosamine hydrolase